MAKFSDFKERPGPAQLSLFDLMEYEAQQRFYGNDKEYTNLLDFYDSIPKHFYGKTQRIEVEGRTEKFLPSLKFDFSRTIQGKTIRYKVILHPARVENSKGEMIEHYPGFREQLVEHALRKFAAHQQAIYLEDDKKQNYFGAVFTLYQLQEELKKLGHSYSKNQIKEALKICADTRIIIKEITPEGEKELYGIKIFETLGLVTRADWKRLGKNTKAFVRFNSVITEAIEDIDFRLAPYEALMGLSSPIQFCIMRKILTRYTYARNFGEEKRKLSEELAGRGLQGEQFAAAYNHYVYELKCQIRPFHLHLTTLFDERVMKKYKNRGDNIRKVEEHLMKLQEMGWIDYGGCNVERDGRKILQGVFFIYATDKLFRAILESNTRKKKATKMFPPANSPQIL